MASSHRPPRPNARMFCARFVMEGDIGDECWSRGRRLATTSETRSEGGARERNELIARFPGFSSRRSPGPCENGSHAQSGIVPAAAKSRGVLECAYLGEQSCYRLRPGCSGVDGVV